jgi:hypothetical protein
MAQGEGVAVSNPVDEIEVQLRRSAFLRDDVDDQRAKLNQNFARLDPDQSAKLLERLLTFDGARLPSIFVVFIEPFVWSCS